MHVPRQPHEVQSKMANAARQNEYLNEQSLDEQTDG